MAQATVRERTTLVCLSLAAVILAVVLASLVLDMTLDQGHQSPIAGDPVLYNDIGTAIVDGYIPYLDFTVEHLPGALIPITGVEALARMSGATFESLWPLTMGAIFVLTTLIASGLPGGVRSARRFLLLSIPLLPIVLFRLEPWLLLWVVASLALGNRSQWASSSWAIAVAALIKGWPLVLFALPVRLGKRPMAAVLAAATVLVLGVVVLLPGFQSGRAFNGIHSETLVGSLVLFWRGVNGADPRLIGSAGAVYVAVGGWAAIANGLIGLPFISVGLHRLAKSCGVRAAMRPAGLTTLGIIIASPLFSSQFLFWLVPFIVLEAVLQRRIYTVAALVTLGTVVEWVPSNLTWGVFVLGRNVLLVILAGSLALALAQDTDHTAPSENVS